MPLLNYTTSIDCEKTIGEITKILVRHGATEVITDYQDKLPSAVTFCLSMKGKMVAYALPANYAGVLKAMENDKKVPRNKCNPEQALRVSWRIVKDWVEAQCAIVEAQLADVAEVFLPYAITDSGQTLFEYISSDKGKQLLLSN